jgi:hypothetical protein
MKLSGGTVFDALSRTGAAMATMSAGSLAVHFANWLP